MHNNIVVRMISDGWMSEVEDLLSSGIDVSGSAMSAIGYRQVAKHLRGELDLDGMIEEIVIATNRLIGAQRNWFKPNDGRITWIDVTTADADEIAQSKVAEWLSRTELAADAG